MDKTQYVVLNSIDGHDELYEQIGLAAGHIFKKDDFVHITLDELNKLIPGLLTELCRGCLEGDDVHPNPIYKALKQSKGK